MNISAWADGVEAGSTKDRFCPRGTPPSRKSAKKIGPLNFGKKLAGKRGVGKPQAAFEAGGDGNGVKER
ncbi:MAG: hypothetical protein MI674_06090 [Cytophagales bacterium]|nr:hypothetical protein [Cytophagales bacterium]